MSYITLTYDLAMAAGRDAGNRSMRAAGRTKWSAEDYDAMIARVDRLALALYHGHHPGEMGPVDLDQAHYELQCTKGMSCIVKRGRAS